VEHILPKISVIVPVYKNKDTVVGLHSLLVKTLSDLNNEFEIVFVDDQCPQRSIDVLNELAEQDDRVTVIGLAQNIGQQNAVLAGLMYSHGLTALIMDADLQDPPTAIPDLLAKLNEGYDVVFAGRRGSYQAASRLLTSRMYKWVLHIITRVPSDAGLFMAVRRDAINKVLKVKSDNPHLVAMLGVLNLNTTSIPVVRALRPTGESSYTSWMRMKVGLGAAFWALKWKLGMRKMLEETVSRFPVRTMKRSKYFS